MPRILISRVASYQMRFWSSKTFSLRTHRAASDPKRRNRRLWEFLASIVILLIVGVFFALSIVWPYSQKKISASIEQTFDVDVKIQNFRNIYFPHPGCRAQFVAITRPHNSENPTTTVTIQQIIITGAYTDLIFRPHRLQEIRLNGLNAKIRLAAQSKSQSDPLNSSGPHNASSQQSGDPKSLESKPSIGTILTTGAVLEIEPGDGRTPLKFEIRKITVDGIAADRPMNYRLSMGIPEPPGELESRGTLGPWQSEPGRVQLKGIAHLAGAKLDKYPGIGGTVESSERFTGTLDHLETSGEAAVPDFVLKSANHPVHLHTNFHIIVNPMQGEVQIRQADVRVGHTTARFQATVTRNPRNNRRETKVDFFIQRGRAEDVLWLFSHRAKPPMFGEATCSGHAVAPEFGEPFLKKLQVKGRFDVRDGHFEPNAQSKTNVLSARAQGKKLKDPDDAPPVFVEDLSSDVVIKKALAHFSDLNFEVPGANARMHGTFNFLNDQVNLHGDLRTDAPISKDTSGLKSVLLKPLDPFFHKKHAGAQIPVVMDGSISRPHFATDIVKKR